MLAARAQALNAPLRTERLALEPLVSAHADALFAALMDERIYEWISPVPPTDLETLRSAWARRESRLSLDGSEARLNWAVRRAVDGAYVGRLDATVDDANVATNYGYVLMPGYWGQGYATECTRHLMSHFAQQGVREVRACVTLGNVASERVLEKSCFVRTRVIPNNDRIRGVWYDDVEYVYQPPTSP
jgi:[ribosomal protein S5]-alanine N-acetyltransferase